jgi:UDP-N-acetylmuramate dehydrogenase
MGRSYDINGDVVRLRLGAGENWHEVVTWALEMGWRGLENLVLIPGFVGAAPIQNIGAYGRELKDVLLEVVAYDLQEEKLCRFDIDACQFSYRDSHFKQNPQRYLITEVCLELDQKRPLEYGYGDVQERLKHRGQFPPSASQLAEVIMEIRREKLPDPKVLGNAGSFFKNPILNHAEAERFKGSHPQAKFFELEGGGIKVAAGWLIDQLNWKGRGIGNVSVHEKQALVLVRNGSAKGPELLALISAIQKDVTDVFGIDLVPEVNLIGIHGRLLGCDLSTSGEDV